MKLDNSPSPSVNGASHSTLTHAPPHGKNERVKATPANWQIVMIPVDQIARNPYQPRLQFDEGEMAELIASVRERGVQQPILVRTPRPK